MVEYFKSGPRSSRGVSGDKIQKAIERNRAKVAKRQLPSRGISLTELKNKQRAVGSTGQPIINPTNINKARSTSFRSRGPEERKLWNSRQASSSVENRLQNLRQQRLSRVRGKSSTVSSRNNTFSFRNISIK